MGWFSKKIKYYQLRKILRKIPTSILDPEERGFVLGLFWKYKSGGITKQEVEKAIKEMKWGGADPIDQYEAKKIYEELIKYFD